MRALGCSPVPTCTAFFENQIPELVGLRLYTRKCGLCRGVFPSPGQIYITCLFGHMMSRPACSRLPTFTRLDVSPYWMPSGELSTNTAFNLL